MRERGRGNMLRREMDERRTDPRGERLVLRVEISAEEGSVLGPEALAAGLERLVVPTAPPAPRPEPASDQSAEQAELERRSAALAAREGELEARLTEVEREHNARLADVERLAAEGESELEDRDGLTASEKIRLAARARRASELEEDLGERLRDLDEREARLDTREAEFEADVELREQRMERWRAELTELEQRLDRKESELLLYVGELQGELSRREVGWWPTGAAPGTIRHH
jgi:DNA repair exonuclease SbcCD ATPase subunit